MPLKLHTSAPAGSCGFCTSHAALLLTHPPGTRMVLFVINKSRETDANSSSFCLYSAAVTDSQTGFLVSEDMRGNVIPFHDEQAEGREPREFPQVPWGQDPHRVCCAQPCGLCTDRASKRCPRSHPQISGLRFYHLRIRGSSVLPWHPHPCECL